MHVVEALAFLTEPAKHEQTISSHFATVVGALLWHLAVGY